MALLHSDPAELHGIQPEWSWMQWLPFPVYEFFPRWPAYSSDAFCFRNLNIQFMSAAWHSRYKTVYPHTLGYRMMRAIVEDDVEEILKILKNPRFDVNGPIDKKYGLTALQMASLINRFPTVELLLLYGANINLRDRHGNTPLILAVEKRNYQTMHSLLMNGCDRDLTNHYGFTAIDKANGEEKIVQFIKSFEGTKRRFPKFKIQLQIEKKIHPPVWKQIANLKIYSSTILTHPLMTWRYELLNSHTVQEILDKDKRDKQLQEKLLALHTK